MRAAASPIRMSLHRSRIAPSKTGEITAFITSAGDQPDRLFDTFQGLSIPHRHSYLGIIHVPDAPALTATTSRHAPGRERIAKVRRGSLRWNSRWQTIEGHRRHHVFPFVSPINRMSPGDSFSRCPHRRDDQITVQHRSARHAGNRGSTPAEADNRSFCIPARRLRVIVQIEQE